MTQPRKIMVAGMSGSGKTTIAGIISKETDLPHISIDSHCFDSSWHRKERSEILPVVSDLLSGDSWVVDGMYNDIADEFIERADLVIYVKINIFRNLYNVIIRKLNHILHPTGDSYIGNKRSIKFLNVRQVCYKRKEYYQNWNRILEKADGYTRIIRIKDTRQKTVNGIIETIQKS